VYTRPFSVGYGLVGPEAEVIATADAAGEYPATFVYEAGTHLLDGSVAPGMRMGLFIGQADAAFAFSDLGENALALFDAAVAFGLTRTPVSLLAGDADDDGDVDDDDLSLLLANWGQDTDWNHGEFSGVPPVDDDDLSLLLANWTGPLSRAVPEPATIGLVGLGLPALLRRRK